MSDTSAADRTDDRPLAAALAALAAAVGGLLHLALGPNFVLDDWFTVGHARIDGMWGAAGPAQQVARPGAWLTYALTFGYLGDHPVAILLVQIVVNSVTAAFLFLVLRRYLQRGPAAWVVIIWIVLPNHMSLEVWASAVNIALSAMLLVLGCYLISSPRVSAASVVAGVLCLSGSVLFYEASLFVAIAAIIVLPRLSTGRFDKRVLIGGAAGVGAAAGWIVWHWHPAKGLQPWADFGQTLPAHFGWGIVPNGPIASLFLVAAIGCICYTLVRFARPATAGDKSAGWVVIAGLGIIVLGTLPFVRYFYAPLGAGDRVNFLSSIGGAMVWTGIGMTLVRQRALLIAGAGALVLFGFVARLQMAAVWNTAGDDALAILTGIKAAHPRPEGPIVLGPVPIQRANVAALLDTEFNFTPALQWLYDDPKARGQITYSQEEYDRLPGPHFDLRTVSRLEGGADR